MDVNDMKPDLKWWGVSMHEGAHVAACVLLHVPFGDVFRDTAMTGGTQVGRRSSEGVTPKETVAFLEMELVATRAPYFAGELEQMWSAGDTPDVDRIIRAARKAAPDFVPADFQRSVDAWAKSLVNDPDFASIQNAVAKALYTKTYLTEAEVKEIVATVYPRGQKVMKYKPAGRVSNVGGETIIPHSINDPHLTDSGRTILTDYAKKNGVPVEQVRLVVRPLTPDEITSREKQKAARKAKRQRELLDPNGPTPTPKAILEQKRREDAADRAEELRIAKEIAELAKRLDEPSTPSDEVDALVRQVRAENARKAAEQENKEPKRFGPDGEEVL